MPRTGIIASVTVDSWDRGAVVSIEYVDERVEDQYLIVDGDGYLIHFESREEYDAWNE